MNREWSLEEADAIFLLEFYIRHSLLVNWWRTATAAKGDTWKQASFDEVFLHSVKIASHEGAVNGHQIIADRRWHDWFTRQLPTHAHHITTTFDRKYDVNASQRLPPQQHRSLPVVMRLWPVPKRTEPRCLITAKINNVVVTVSMRLFTVKRKKIIGRKLHIGYTRWFKNN